MSAKKANELLGVSDSEDDDAQGYDSEQEVSKGGRSAKRRKTDSDHEDDASDDDADADAADDLHSANEDLEIEQEDAEDKADPTEDTAAKPKVKLQPQTSSISNSFLKRNLVTTDAAIKKSGVVYLSRIPPFMKPAKLRNLLQPYGTINRVFLAPEDPAAHARRVRNGGNKKRSFTEGWVEFTRKKDAKAASELLNGHTIGGKKGTYYRDDLWNLLYLKGFKWHNLTEQITAENAERTSRMRAEISKSTRENKEFAKNVEMGKMLDGMEAKAKTKKRKPEDEGAVEVEADSDKRPAKRERTRTFRQTEQVKKRQTGEQQPDQVMRTLSKIF